MSEPYVGEIRMFAGNYAPQGWAFCDGQLLPIAENEVLFALIGTTYGGDGRTNFAVPDMRGRIPVHMGTNPKTGTNYSLAQKGGTEQVTLAASQLPVHTHQARALSASATVQSPGTAVWSKSANNPYAPASAINSSMETGLVSPAGNALPDSHENMMPFLTVSFIIALNGIFPSQN